MNNLIIALVYGYIETRTDIKIIEDWYFELEKTYSKWQDDQILIIGDINAHIGNDCLGVEGNTSKVNKSGEILRSFVERRELTIINNTDICCGKWTREDPKGGKSILDLAICNQNLIGQITRMSIDEDHKLKLIRRKKKASQYIDVKSDHNSITLEVIIDEENTKNQQTKYWNIKDENGWLNYQQETSKMHMKVKWDDHEDLNIKYKKMDKTGKVTNV